MAELNTEAKPQKGGKKKPKKLSTRVDLTPMVDLAFLLLTFFMLATSMIKPQTMEIALPTKDKDQTNTPVKASKSITIVMGKNNKLFYYFGTKENGVNPEVITSNYSAKGIRQILLDRNKYVVSLVKKLKAQRANGKISEEQFKKLATEARGDKDSPVVLIKATDEASYKNLVDILDEMAICNIGRYAIVDVKKEDREYIKDKDI
jgi:Biopolymer transport protein